MDLNHRGVYTALITPFTADGKVDYTAFEALLEFLIDKGVHGLFPLGTTGEGILMSVEERKQVAQFVVRAANNRVPVIVHVGHVRTEETIELARHAASVGASAVAAVTPYYFHLGPSELFQHYVALSQAVPEDFPIFTYHIPSNARNAVTPELIKRLLDETPNIRGLKYSSDQLTELQDILLAAGDDLTVMLGPDHLVLPGLTLGIQGSVSGCSNVFPEPYVRLFHAYWAGQLQEAQRQQKIIAELVRIFRAGARLSLFKEALAFRGLTGGHVRAPLGPLSADEQRVLFEQLESLAERYKW
jgi:4-hydroxy-tetrahydrodipicolinate synthase